MEKLGRGRVVMQLLTLGYAAAFARVGSDAGGWAGMCRSLPVWFTGTVGTLWTRGTALSKLLPLTSWPESSAGQQPGSRGTSIWVGALSVAGCTFQGTVRFLLHHRRLLLPPVWLRMAVLVLSLGRDRAGAAASGAFGLLITLFLIEDHLHLVI